jgi:ribonucleoside-diphosphate reductase alpha chain
MSNPTSTRTASPEIRTLTASPPTPNRVESKEGGEGFQVIRRNGKVTSFDASKIAVALTKAFLAVEGGSAATSTRIHHTVQELTDQVVAAFSRRQPGGGNLHIEDIQDQVELALMRAGEHKVARAYGIYREERARERAAKAAQEVAADTPVLRVTLADHSLRPLDMGRLRALVS